MEISIITNSRALKCCASRRFAAFRVWGKSYRTFQVVPDLRLNLLQNAHSAIPMRAHADRPSYLNIQRGIRSLYPLGGIDVINLQLWRFFVFQ
jgi:hypothetical protein